jgi:small nuclear ribonucleoprotein (snRNP)-like protein
LTRFTGIIWRMSIRQIRLNSTDQIKSRIREFEGKRIQVVLSNNTSIYGELKAVEELGIVLENRRMKKNLLQFDSITEIYFDQQV